MVIDLAPDIAVGVGDGVFVIGHCNAYDIGQRNSVSVAR